MRSWQFVINGRPIFARGGNWVPGDMAYGALVADARRYRRLLNAAKLVGYTFLRIWGGGNIEVTLTQSRLNLHVVPRHKRMSVVNHTIGTLELGVHPTPYSRPALGICVLDKQNAW